MKHIILAILSGIAFSSLSQTNTLSIDKAIAEALKNNTSIKASIYEVEVRKQLQKTSFELPKTDVTLLYGQYNSYAKNDNNITVTQSIPFSAFGRQQSLNRALTNSSKLQQAVAENEIVYQVKQVFYQLVFAKARHTLLQQQDSIYDGFMRSASLRYKTGEANLLEQTTATAQRSEAINQLRQNYTEIVKLQSQLKTLINSPTVPEVVDQTLTKVAFDIIDTVAYQQNPVLSYRKQQVEVAQREKKLQAAKVAPDLLVGFFSQTLIGTPEVETGAVATGSDRFTGFQIGVSIPLWLAPHQARVRAAEFNKRAVESNFEYFQQSLQSQLQQALEQLATYKNSLDYYLGAALPNADLILKQAQIAFREGEIDYAEYLLGIRNGISIKESYLKTLNDYNQSIIYIEYLIGKK
jgi:cobalt-zinc-cadmium resistance protein CzcA